MLYSSKRTGPVLLVCRMRWQFDLDQDPILFSLSLLRSENGSVCGFWILWVEIWRRLSPSLESRSVLNGDLLIEIRAPLRNTFLYRIVVPGIIMWLSAKCLLSKLRDVTFANFIKSIKHCHTCRRRLCQGKRYTVKLGLPTVHCQFSTARAWVFGNSRLSWPRWAEMLSQRFAYQYL